MQFDPFLPDVKVQLSDGSERECHVASSKPPSARLPLRTTRAANGANASLLFTAKQAGSNLTGVTINFVENSSITPGNETANYNATTKTLTFDIDQGQSTANDIINALNSSPTASALFSAKRPTAATAPAGHDLRRRPDRRSKSDRHHRRHERAQMRAVQFTAVSGGPNFDNVQVEFQNNASITAGHETVAYDTTDPNSPKLVFQVAEGQTTASDIVQALANNSSVSQLFTASLPTGDSGTGLISTADTATTRRRRNRRTGVVGCADDDRRHFECLELRRSGQAAGGKSPPTAKASN